MKLVITVDTDDAAACPETPYTATVHLDGDDFFTEAILGETLPKTLEQVKNRINGHMPTEATIRDRYKDNSTFRHLIDSAVESWTGADTPVFHADNDYLRGQVELIRDVIQWKTGVDQDQVRQQLIDLIAELVNPDR